MKFESIVFLAGSARQSVWSEETSSKRELFKTYTNFFFFPTKLDFSASGLCIRYSATPTMARKNIVCKFFQQGTLQLQDRRLVLYTAANNNQVHAGRATAATFCILAPARRPQIQRARSPRSRATSTSISRKNGRYTRSVRSRRASTRKTTSSPTATFRPTSFTGATARPWQITPALLL